LHLPPAMKILLFAFCLTVALARAASADTIVWIDEGALTSSNFGTIQPGPPIGTPWSLQVTFDSAAPGTPRFGPPGSSCFQYPIQGAAFTLGGFNYTASGGTIATNFRFDAGCFSGLTGETTLEIGGWTSQDPAAWNLSNLLFLASYRDAVARDGSLPIVPTLTGFNSGMRFISPAGSVIMSDNSFSPQALVENPTNPTPVPEPATMTMLGIGLAYAARRRVRKGRL
jgi:PEP-CTERM motif